MKMEMAEKQKKERKTKKEYSHKFEYLKSPEMVLNVFALSLELPWQLNLRDAFCVGFPNRKQYFVLQLSEIETALEKKRKLRDESEVLWMYF
jgi:hypothetical protein